MTDFTQWRKLEDQHPVYRDMVDAADYHFRIDEGSGSSEITCDITGEVGTIQGATWVEGNWTGGWGLDFTPSANSGDGAWVEFDITSEAFGGSDYLWVSVAFESRDVNSRGILASVVDVDNSDRWNIESGSWDMDGRIGWWMAGDNNITSGGGSLSNGTQYHTIGIHDNENDYREIMLNGESMNTDTAAGTIPGGEPTTLKMGRRGPGDRTLDGVIGEVMIGQTPLDDYDKNHIYGRQPFA